MSEPVSFPALSSEEQHDFVRGIEQFNAGLFFECHDTLEEIWSGVRGPSRDFFQGLIQVAVGFYHWSNGNSRGSLTLLGRGLARLEKYGERFGGVDLAQLRAETQAWRGCVEAGESFPESLDVLPKVRILPADR